MAIDPSQLELAIYPAPILKGRAETVKNIDDDVRAVSKRMIEMLYEHNGVGLAAPQIGLPWRLFVTRANPGSESQEVDSGRVFINPELTTDPVEIQEMEEGCLSIPDVHISLKRPSHAVIRAFDENGNAFEEHDTGYAARVWQHEFDHLNGVLIIDKMTPMDRLVTRKTLKALRDSYKGT